MIRIHPLVSILSLVFIAGCFDRRYPLAPTTARDFCRLAEAWDRHGDQERCLLAYDNAIATDQSYAQAYLGRSKVWLKQRRRISVAAAYADLTKAIDLDPSNAEVHLLRGAIELNNRDFAAAIQDLTKAIKTFAPQEVPDEAYLNRAMAFTGAKRSSEALDDYGTVIRRGAAQPDYAMAVQRRGDLFVDLKRFEDALTDYNLLLDNPKIRSEIEQRARADLYRSRAGIFQLVGRYKPAIADMRQLLAQNLQDVQTLNGLGWIFATCPDPSIVNPAWAMRYAQRAVELTAWTDPDLIDTLAAAYARSGDFTRAVEWEQAAIDMKTSQDEVRSSMESRLRLFNKKQAFTEPLRPSP
jgi:tetratricopeptide (TPR) repeat protein